MVFIRQYISWILVLLMLFGLFGFSSTVLAEKGKWTKKANMPTARHSLSTSTVNGKIYAIGGTPGDGRALSTVEEYDPKRDTWIKKKGMPTARAHLSTSVVNGKVYAIGGMTSVGLPGLPPVSTVEEYDPQKDTWIKKKEMPIARLRLSTNVVNGKIYAIGGWTSFGLAGRPGLSTVEEYDPQKDTWIKKKEMPTARGWLSTSVVNGKIYAIGGGATTSGPMLSTVEEYDPATDTWTKKADMPTAKGGFFTSVVNGKIYAISGDGAVEEYDPTIDKWAKKAADMPTKRWAFSTSAVDGEIYAIGGTPGRGVSFSTVEAYDTGFAGLYIEARGKLPTSWGKIKSSY